MEYDNGPAHKAARMLVEAARRSLRRQQGVKDPSKHDTQIHLQLLVNGLKKELKDKGFQIF